MSSSDDIKKIPDSDKSPPHDISREDFLRRLDSMFSLFEKNHQTTIKKIQLNKRDVMTNKTIYGKHERARERFAFAILYNKCILDATNSLHVEISRRFDNFRSEQGRTHLNILTSVNSMLRVYNNLHKKMLKSLNTLYIWDC